MQAECNTVAESQSPAHAASPCAGERGNTGRTDLLKAAETVAIRGLDEYKGWWLSISAEERKIIGMDEHERLKAIAMETIQAEPAAVEETQS